jgi:hypothetical protein
LESYLSAKLADLEFATLRDGKPPRTARLHQSDDRNSSRRPAVKTSRMYQGAGRRVR